MKWLADKKKGPIVGQERKVKRFAYLPTKVSKYWVWLESYYSWETFKREYEHDFDTGFGGDVLLWKVTDRSLR